MKDVLCLALKVSQQVNRYRTDDETHKITGQHNGGGAVARVHAGHKSLHL